MKKLQVAGKLYFKKKNERNDLSFVFSELRIQSFKTKTIIKKEKLKIRERINQDIKWRARELAEMKSR